jgi:membrane protease YdiL (CAAX protease family)
MSEEPLYPSSVVDASDPVYRDDAYLDETLPSARVPHLGHAVLFVSFAGLLLFLTQLVAVSLARASHGADASAQILIQPKWELASMAATYIAALGACFLVFPLLWERAFLDGVNWNGAHAPRLAVRLVSLGLSVGWCVQALSSLVPMPKSVPMNDFFRTPSDVWLVTLFGTLLAPLFEEVTFRGFLLPAFSIAFDWLGPMLRYSAAFSMARLRGKEPAMQVAVFREAAAAGLQPGTGNLFFRSKTAVAIASVLSSVLFAWLHAEQLGHAWAAVGILFGVSLLLSVVRVKTQSLVCSTIVHASYNLSVFVTLFLATGGYRHLDRIGR